MFEKLSAALVIASFSAFCSFSPVIAAPISQPDTSIELGGRLTGYDGLGLIGQQSNYGYQSASLYNYPSSNASYFAFTNQSNGRNVETEFLVNFLTYSIFYTKNTAGFNVSIAGGDYAGTVYDGDLFGTGYTTRAISAHIDSADFRFTTDRSLVQYPGYIEAYFATPLIFSINFRDGANYSDIEIQTYGIRIFDPQLSAVPLPSSSLLFGCGIFIVGIAGFASKRLKAGVAA